MSQSIFHWSGGKDAMLALHKVRTQHPEWKGKLLTTINEHRQRVTMHGVRISLMDAQARALGIPLSYLPLPENIEMDDYSSLLKAALITEKSRGFDHHIYGDIHLTDLRSYRDHLLSELHMKADYPLWKQPTASLAKEFIDLGYRAIVVAANAKLLDASFVGRVFDHDFLRDLPKDIDPCGENGEFHTFVVDGPLFKHPLPITIGETTYHTYQPKKETEDCFCEDETETTWDYGFWFCDLQ